MDSGIIPARERAEHNSSAAEDFIDVSTISVSTPSSEITS